MTNFRIRGQDSMVTLRVRAHDLRQAIADAPYPLRPRCPRWFRCHLVTLVGTWRLLRYWAVAVMCRAGRASAASRRARVTAT
jgi:hypothetical protein